MCSIETTHAEYGCVVPTVKQSIYSKLCVVREVGESKFDVLQAITINGTVEELDRYERPHPWMDLAVTEDSFGSQWLSLTYNGEGSQADGKSHHISIYNLSKREKVLSGYSTDPFELRDINNDGYLEHAFYVPLVFIEYYRQVGWPVVFTLGDEVKLADQDDSLRAASLREANSIKTHLEGVCAMFLEDTDAREYMGNWDCPYEQDILILSKQIELFSPK